jgi:hypothetical protein
MRPIPRDLSVSQLKTTAQNNGSGHINASSSRFDKSKAKTMLILAKSSRRVH